MTPELQPQELGKLTAIASAMTGAMRERDVADLVAEVGFLVFRLTFECWVHTPAQKFYATLFRTLLHETGAVAMSAAAEVNALQSGGQQGPGSSEI